MQLPYKAMVGSLAAVSVIAASGAAFAQSSTGMENGQRPVPTQECLQAMADLAEVQLAHFDERMAAEETRLEEHLDNLNELAAITDDDERRAALQAQHEEMKNKEPPTIPEDVQAAMDAVREACEGAGFMMKGPGMGHGPMGQGGPGQGGPGMFKMMRGGEGRGPGQGHGQGPMGF